MVDEEDEEEEDPFEGEDEEEILFEASDFDLDEILKELEEEEMTEDD